MWIRLDVGRNACTVVIIDWMGLDWIIKLLGWVGLDLAKWIHVQFYHHPPPPPYIARG